MPSQGRSYPVLGVKEVHDGDTVRLLIDVGFEACHFPWLRVRDLYCPELGKPGGQEAKEAAVELLEGADQLWVTTFKRPGWTDMEKSFARYIAEIGIDGRSFAETMVELGHGHH